MLASSSLLNAQPGLALDDEVVPPTPPDAAFDELVALAARICGTPISLVTLFEPDRPWLKAHHGLASTEIAQALSFCAQTPGQPDELVIVPDVTCDARFVCNPLDPDQSGFRFYTGVPLHNAEGRAVGMLCVIDREPRNLDADQQDALRVLGRQVMAQLELRRTLNETNLNAARLENSQRIAGLGDWEYDFIRHRLLWSEEVYQILGLSRQDAPPASESFYLRVHPEDLAFVHREKKAAVTDLRRVDFEHRIIRPDGEVRHVHQIVEIAFDARGMPIRESGTIQDITDRKLAVEALRQSEERYRKLLMLSPDANFVQVDGLITLVNRAFCQLMHAAEPVELLGRPALDVVHPAFHDLARERQEKHRHDQPIAPSEMKFIRLDGTTVDVEVNAVAFDFHGRREMQVVARDISARRAAEAALRESEERFKFVARAVSDAVWDWNIPSNRLWWNDGFLSTFGYLGDEIEGGIESWTSRIHPDERAAVIEGFHHAVNTGTESWSAEYRFKRKDGNYAFVQDRGYILRDAAGKGLRMVGGMRDLTEQKKMEAQYLRAQRMESIGTLAGGIAHDLNNVLAPIMMSIEMLKMDSPNDPRRSRILETILASCCRGADLVRQVLSFARGLDGQRIAIRLRHLIEELEAIISGTFPRNIRVSCQVANDLWPITGDPSQLHQVLLNLAVNARDAMAEGGLLTLAASNVTLDAQYAGTSQEAKAGTYVLLQVSDTGMGIPPEVREKIFEPFFTTKELGHGTGLGLSTVHTVVKSHGGFLNVESEVGRGTTFKIYLPADPAHRTIATVHPFSAKLPRGRGELVLVVDDELSICDITRQTLEVHDYRVITANDGAEGVALYATQPQKIAVVLIDMMMPIMDGATTIQVLTRINPAVKIIAASGLQLAGNVGKSVRAGVHDFLAKPYTAETLLTRIREVIDRAPVVPG